jgi:hypothetical protein
MVPQSTTMIIPPYTGSDEVISQQGVYTARTLVEAQQEVPVRIMNMSN